MLGSNILHPSLMEPLTDPAVTTSPLSGFILDSSALKSSWDVHSSPNGTYLSLFWQKNCRQHRWNLCIKYEGIVNPVRFGTQ